MRGLCAVPERKLNAQPYSRKIHSPRHDNLRRRAGCHGCAVRFVVRRYRHKRLGTAVRAGKRSAVRGGVSALRARVDAVLESRRVCGRGARRRRTGAHTAEDLCRRPAVVPGALCIHLHNLSSQRPRPLVDGLQGLLAVPGQRALRGHSSRLVPLRGNTRQACPACVSARIPDRDKAHELPHRRLRRLRAAGLLAELSRSRQRDLLPAQARSQP